MTNKLLTIYQSNRDKISEDNIITQPCRKNIDLQVISILLLLNKIKSRGKYDSFYLLHSNTNCNMKRKKIVPSIEHSKEETTKERGNRFKLHNYFQNVTIEPLNQSCMWADLKTSIS